VLFNNKIIIKKNISVNINILIILFKAYIFKIKRKTGLENTNVCIKNPTKHQIRWFHTFLPVVIFLTAAVRVRVCMWVVLNSHRLLDNKQCASSSSPSFCCFFATLFGEKFFRLRKTGSVKNGAGSMRGGRVLEKLQPK